jgi:hypothetical protein
LFDYGWLGEPPVTLLQEVAVPQVEAVVGLLQEAVVLLPLLAVVGLQEAVALLLVEVGTPIPITRIRTPSRTRGGCRGGGVPGFGGGLSATP